MTCSNPVSAVSDDTLAVAALTCCTDTVDPPPDEEPVVVVTHRTLNEAAYRAFTPYAMQSPRYEPASPGGPLVTFTNTVPTDVVDTNNGSTTGTPFHWVTIDWL